MWRELFSPFSYASITTFLLIASLHVAGAQVMQSGNFQIQSDSINFGGGFSTSSNYRLESTAGEVGTGESDSENYALKAGYQQMQEVYIAISGAANVTMSPSIPGVTGGTANGSTTVTVTTDSPAGYELTIASETSPAMQKGADSIADYAPAGANPDFTFTTGAADAHFGYTPQGTDVVQRFLDNGASCNTGSSNAALSCWDGLSMTPETIASQTTPNHPGGTVTTVYFRVGVGGSVVQPAGVYAATTTLTALAL
jgi:hypothetical protein